MSTFFKSDSYGARSNVLTPEYLGCVGFNRPPTLDVVNFRRNVLLIIFLKNQRNLKPETFMVTSEKFLRRSMNKNNDALDFSTADSLDYYTYINTNTSHTNFYLLNHYLESFKSIGEN